MAVRIEKSSQSGKTTIYLIGHFQSEHLEELKKQFLENRSQLVLDLKEVTQVDVDVVRFLGTCRAAGVKIAHCPRYIREWISRERRAGAP
jgi:anti-anti-sigma regulatory factor